ncbi:hypothetical protein KAJ89_02100 [Candidatus Parcubacteria bacterium]|nr:hypothetical protein [Candidatus Parcubacteria bacterium]
MERLIMFSGFGGFILFFWAIVIDFWGDWTINEPKFIICFILSLLAMGIDFIEMIDEKKIKPKNG